MYTEETVRKELRGVARKRVNMSALIGTRDYLTAQIKYLGESDKLSPETETALASATKTIISLIEETAERDSKYIKCISSLTQLHKTIILEHYFNGTDDDGGITMNDERTNAGGFEESDMFKWLNEDFFALLPDEWQEIIVPVVKKTANCGGSDAKIVDTTCKVFIPSEVEVFGECHYSKKGEGEQYDGFKNWKDRVKGYPDGGWGCWYWLRSPHSGDNNYFGIVMGDGSYNYNFANYACEVAPCFAI